MNSKSLLLLLGLASFSITPFAAEDSSGSTVIINIYGSPNHGWSIPVGVGGDQGQSYFTELILDTGSSNTGIVEGVPCKNKQPEPVFSSSDSFEDTGREVTVTYTAGEWSGRLGIDNIFIRGLGKVSAFVVAIREQDGFCIQDARWNGILGLAEKDLAKPDNSVTPLLDEFINARGLANVFALMLCAPFDNPHNDIIEPQSGIMSVGGIDDSMTASDVIYTPRDPGTYYRVLILSLSVNEQLVDIHGCAQINDDQTTVDSGTTDYFFHWHLYQAIVSAFRNQTASLPLDFHDFWSGGSALLWPRDLEVQLWPYLPVLHIFLAHSGHRDEAIKLSLSPSLYMRRIPFTAQEQLSTNCYLDCRKYTFSIRPRQRGNVIGGKNSFTTVYDREEQRIGFAMSTCRYSQSQNDNPLPEANISVISYPVPEHCHSAKHSDIQYWQIVTYVCGGIVAPLAVISVAAAAIHRCDQNTRRRAVNWLILSFSSIWNYLHCSFRARYPIQETNSGDIEMDALDTLNAEESSL